MIAADQQITKAYEINAPTSKVWEALTNPKMIKQYFFGTEASSDWKEGSMIFYRGEWEGKAYEDKAIILKLIPQQLLIVNYWSNRSGKPDLPENYSLHSYELKADGNKTKLILGQEDSFKSDESRGKAWQHWDVVVDGLKKLVETKAM